MDIVQIAQSFFNTNGVRARHYDDLWTDRLCYRWSVLILVIFAALITTKAYVGDPIDCWSPPEFKASYERYAETLCYVNGTYYISADEHDIPTNSKERYSNRIRYYQWTPFILLFQAVLMYVPRIFWVSFNKRNGLNIYGLVDAAIKYESLDSFSEKEKILVYICKNLLRSIQFYDHSHKKDYTSSDGYKCNRTEISKLLMMQPETSTESSKNYNESLLKILMSTISKNAKNHKRIIIIDPEKGLPTESYINEKNNRLGKDLYQIVNKNIPDTLFKAKPARSRSIEKVDKLIDAERYRKQKKSDSSKESIESFFEQEKKLNEFSQIKNNMHLIKAKVNSMSKKHIFNILSADYQLNIKASDDMNTDAKINRRSLKKKHSKIVSYNKFIPDFSRNFLSVLYLIVKFLYLGSLVGQFCFLSRLIGNDYYLLGFNFLKSFHDENQWPHMEIFPRVTLCEIFIREIGSVHPYLIQCVLRINLFNEMIFILVWFWLVLLILIMVIEFFFRFFYILITCTDYHRKKFALKYLKLIHMNSMHLKHELTKNIFNQTIDDDLLKRNSESSRINFGNNLVQAEGYEKFYVNTKKKQRNLMTNITTTVYYDNNFNSTLMDADNISSTKSFIDDAKFKSDFEPTIDSCAKKSIKEMNILVKISHKEELEIFEKFCENSFSNDTIFALCVIQQNSSNIVVSEIIEYLWLQFKSCNFIVSCSDGDFVLKKLVIRNEQAAEQKENLTHRHFIKSTFNEMLSECILDENES